MPLRPPAGYVRPGYDPLGGTGGMYGGGGGGRTNSEQGGRGYDGAVRIIWPGTTRQFPSTNTGNF